MTKKVSVAVMEKTIAQFEDQFKKTFVESTARIMGASLGQQGLDKEEIGNVVRVLEELGFGDYILANTYRIALEREEYYSFAKVQIQMYKLTQELEVKHPKILETIGTVANQKAQDWLQLNEETFVEKIQQFL